MNNVFIIVSALQCAFFSCLLLLAFERGIATGMRVSKGIEPAPIKNPIQAITEAKAEKIQKQIDDEMSQAINNIFNYDGNPQKGGGK